MDDKQYILDFIKKHTICVISTMTTDSKPEAAVVGFGETDNWELIFGTLNTSRKYQNLKQNPNIAVVIGWDEDITVQYEGVATELTEEEAEHYKQLYHIKVPRAKKYDMIRGNVYFKISPKWIRYTDINKVPETIVEFTV